jgi:hypothetical protein
MTREQVFIAKTPTTTFGFEPRFRSLDLRPLDQPAVIISIVSILFSNDR